MNFDEPDEQYVYDERLAILMAGENREPTAEERKLARKDVVRFIFEKNS